MKKPERIGLPPPEALGLPSKFKRWRVGQEEAILGAIDAPGRFSLLIQPTGSGKSVCYMTAARLRGVRTLILTSTKGLQNQLMADFGVCDVRGKVAYRCKYDEQWTVEDGPCHFGMACSFKDKGCHYFDALRKAKEASIVSTNYAMWMNMAGREEETIGKFDFMVLDEAHDAPDWVCAHLGIRITKEELRRAKAQGGLPSGNVQDWWRWAGSIRGDVEDRLNAVGRQIRSARSISMVREGQRLKSLERKLNAIMKARPDWVPSYEEDWASLEPVWAKEYAEQVIFRGTPQVYMTSATANLKTVEMMGIPLPDCWVMEQESAFPVERRPVVFVPTVRVDHRMGLGDEAQWLNRIRQIVRSRLDRKGVIHTVSYKRRDAIVAALEQEEVEVYTHTSLSAGRIVADFKASRPPAVLVSPAMATGWDFPYEQCRWQIIAKLGFPDARSEVMKARTKQDRQFAYYVAMQGLVQAAGRGMRAPDDWCENFIIDDHFVWFWGRYRGFAPKWFQKAVQFARVIPPKLQPTGKGEED